MNSSGFENNPSGSFIDERMCGKPLKKSLNGIIIKREFTKNAVTRSSMVHYGADHPHENTSTNLSTSKPVLEGLCANVQNITDSRLSPFQKRVLIALCQVPRSRYTNYKCLAMFLSTSPRAVGNALRHNPFAPSVPCHRVLASDGKLGGFCGSWGRGGKPGLHDEKKRALLRAEGIKFNKNGLVIGHPWHDFKKITI